MMRFISKLVSARWTHQPGTPRLAVRIDITNKCNLQCKMCGYPLQGAEPKYDMPPSLMEKIVSQVLPYAEWATISCQYEPMMSRHFEEIIHILKQSPCPFGFTTNGTLLTERRIRLLLSHPTLRGLSISIDGATKETFERIRVNAKWEKFLANLELLRSVKSQVELPKGFQLQLNTVLMKSTIHELPATVDLAKWVGAASVVAIRYVPIQPALDEAILNWDEYIPVLVEARRRAHSAGIPLLLPIEDPRLRESGELEAERCANVAKIGKFSKYCEAPWSGIQIYPNGDVHPCLYYGEAFGNLAKDDFLDIWNNPRYQELRRSLATLQLHPQCVRCNPHGYDNVEHKARINI